MVLNFHWFVEVAHHKARQHMRPHMNLYKAKVASLLTILDQFNSIGFEFDSLSVTKRRNLVQVLFKTIKNQERTVQSASITHITS